jgi:hypothetical protein
VSDPRIGVLDETDSSETVPASSRDCPVFSMVGKKSGKALLREEGIQVLGEHFWIAEANHR